MHRIFLKIVISYFYKLKRKICIHVFLFFYLKIYIVYVYLVVTYIFIAHLRLQSNKICISHSVAMQILQVKKIVGFSNVPSIFVNIIFLFL